MHAQNASTTVKAFVVEVQVQLRYGVDNKQNAAPESCMRLGGKVIVWAAAMALCPPAGAQTAAVARADLDFFEAKVRPLLVNRCFSCHSTQAKKTRGGLNLDNRAAILRGGDTGPAALP